MRDLKWLGHAAFFLVSDDGLRIVTDPFGKDVPYPEINVEADVVTVSHQHFDHNAVRTVRGNPVVLEGVTSKGTGASKMDRTIRDTRFRTVRTFHDAERGAKRGANAVFVISDESLTVCHLGDLGHLLDEDAVREIGSIDVLLVPVGGYYTIGAAEAWELVNNLKPRVVIPMHHKTNALATWPIASVEDFVRGRSEVRRFGVSAVTLEREKLPETTEVWVLQQPGTT